MVIAVGLRLHKMMQNAELKEVHHTIILQLAKLVIIWLVMGSCNKKMKMLKGKKGFVALLANPIILIILGVLALLIILAVFGFTFFLTLNVFTVLGAMLVIIGGIGLLKGFSAIVGFWLIGIGIVMVIIPAVSENLAGVTLATIMP